MKVLLFSPKPPPIGGIASWTESFLEANNECEIYVVNTANFSGTKIKILAAIKKIVLLFKILYCGWRDINQIKPDIMHLNTSLGSGMLRDYLVEKIAERKKIPVVYHLHCNAKDQVVNNKIAEKLIKICLKKANYVIVLNEYSLQYVKSYTQKVKIIPNYIPRNMIAQEHIIENELRNIIFVGRLCERKGIQEIIQVAKKYPEINFKLVGPIDDGDIKLKLSNNCRYLGSMRKDKVIEQLDQADLFLLPTYTEGFSIALLEAMARGIPCVTTKVGANLEMIENQGGILVQPQNVQEIIEAIDELKDRSRRKKMSDWLLDKVKKTYARELVINQIIEIYKDILDDKDIVH